MSQRPNSATAVRRNARIVTDRLERKLSWKEVAERSGLKERQCRNVVRDWLAAGGSDEDYEVPARVVDKLLAGYEADMWELQEAADAAWTQRNPGVVVGAVKARMDARQRIVELLQATNRLPKNLGHLSVIYDVRFLVEQVIEVFDEHEVPASARRALLDRLQPVIDGTDG